MQWLRDHRACWKGISTGFDKSSRALTRLRLCLSRACRQQGIDLLWEGDEDLSRRALTVQVAGKACPFRPDGLLVASLHTAAGKVRRFPAFIEYQRTSRPVAFAFKVKTALFYLASGRSQEQFGFSTFRLLGLTDSVSRAQTMAQVAERNGGTMICWTAAIEEVVSQPLRPVWFVAGAGNKRQPLRG